MKKTSYLGILMPFSKAITLLLLCFTFCVSAVKSQITYLSTFDNPTSKYDVARPSCTVDVLTPSISNAENVSSGTLTDYATLSTSIANATLICGGTYLLSADLNLNGLTSIPASNSTPYYAGFKIRVNSALLLSLLGGDGGNNLIVKTYLNDVPVQSADANTVGLSLLQPGVLGSISFATEQPFNQVGVEINSGLLSLGAASEIDFFYAYASTAQTPIILPVKLTSFSATTEGKSVGINWIAASEVNVAKYELQSSNDGGITFKTITSIVAKGSNTGEVKYSFVDGAVLAGNYTYRLKMIDKDGRSEYSRLAFVKIATTDKWKIYPTLLSSGTDLNVSLATSNTEKVQVQLANLQGKILRNVSITTGSQLAIATNGLSAGVYVLKLYKDGQLQTAEKVVIH